MHNPDFIEGKLATRTNAVISDREAKNNRWHYQLYFDESIGFDWLETQVAKTAAEIETPLELYKFGPANSYVRVGVRELQRRKGIDEDQQGLDAFEK